MGKITVARYIYKYLVKRNIKNVFGYSGGALLPLLNEFYNSDNINFIKNSNEQCSGYVAEGYSKSLNLSQPGVVISTSGPGVTNLITPLQNAYNDGTPMLAITAQVPLESIGTDAFQECNSTKLTQHCTKWNRLLTNPFNIHEVLDIAYNTAMNSRKGPVHLDIPKNILSIEVDDRILMKDYDKEKEMGFNLLNRIDLCSILLEQSQKPLIIAGQGCNLSDGFLTKVSEKFNIPVTTTLHGMGSMDERHPLCLDMLGMHGHPNSNMSVQESDLIIGIGTRFDDRTVGDIVNYAPNSQNIIHVDNSLEKCNKVRNLFSNTTKTVTTIESDSKNFLKSLHRLNLDKKSDWIKNDKKYYYNETGKLKGPDVIKSINKTIDLLKIDREKTFFTTGVGNHQMWTAQHITWTHPGKIITSGSLGTMGVGVPFAIGSKLANKDHTVICIDGDGSFCMSCNELLTLKENDIPIKIFILNDSRQQMVHVWQKLFHNKRYIGTDNINPDFRLLAEAYDIVSLDCYTKRDLDKCVENILLYDKCAIGIFHIEPEMCYPLVSPGSSLDNMIENENDLENIDIYQPTPN